ncbi:MAG TPA: hypothetical protein VNV42_09280 [Solirubrobacteraceae bacterium]|jgi:hypothetical protein|nr:hypothetical protein [Solirubrobacteraceae bacterium]
MIVRISGDNQYRLDGIDGQINQLDSDVVAAVEAGDEQRFHHTYARLLAFVREHGTPLAEDELEGSDLILPPPDISLAEAQSDFTGAGLIPD